MSKVYNYDGTKFYDIINELYPTNRKLELIDYRCLSKSNLDKLVSSLTNILEDPVVNEIDDTEILGNITCMDEETNKIFNSLFSNPNILVYGHGGAAEEIFKSGKFICCYPDLTSNFISLDNTNESINILDSWPHKSSTQVAIMALNKLEYNPIFCKDDTIGMSGKNNNYILTEYFVGYYDASLKKFIKNPNFKMEHDYNKDAIIREDEEYYTYSMTSDDDNIKEFLHIINKIQNILVRCSFRKITLNSLKNIRVEMGEYIKKLYSLQRLFTKEYIENLSNSENKLEETDAFQFSDDGIWDTEWDEMNVKKV